MSNFLQACLEKRNRIVVFAGVFDPVHIGHISAAREALWYGDKVVFLPEKVPQHKQNTAEYKHRLAMLKIAIRNEKNMEVLDYPEDHQFIEPTFTWLQSKFKDRSFMWLVGSDVLSHISTWPNSDRLAEFAVKGIVVLPRYKDASETNRPTNVHGTPVNYRYRVMRKRSHQKINSRSIKEDMPTKHTSLPDGVYDYIKKHRLYS